MSRLVTFQPTIGQLSPAIGWLLDHGVERRRVAAAFQLNRGYLRVIEHRRSVMRPAAGRVPEASNNEGRDPQPLVDGSVILTRAGRLRLDALGQDIDAAQQGAAASGLLLDGVRALRRLSVRLGAPRSVELIRLRARLRHHTAWCLVHTGFSRSAAAAAALAAGDGLACYRETEAPEDLDIAGSAGLVAAQAQLLMHRPKRALRSLLNVARTAALMKRRAPADYLRQLGVVAFQMEDDRRARALFAQAARALAETEPHCRPIDVEFTAARYTLCESRPSWDAAAELLTRVVAAFPGESLQRSMMVHWTVAAGFSTDSAALRRASETLLDDERQTASRYAHQATVNRLLGVTPNLQLDIWLRRQWLRWVMYANAFAAR